MHICAVHSASPSRLEMMEWLKQQEVAIDGKDNHGNTPMHRAANHGCIGMVKRLKEQGADINDKNRQGKTPLQLANKHPAVVKWLEEQGAQ